MKHLAICLALATLPLASCAQITNAQTAMTLERREGDLTAAYIAAQSSFNEMRSRLPVSSQTAVQAALDRWLAAIHAADDARKKLDNAGLALALANAERAKVDVGNIVPSIAKDN